MKKTAKKLVFKKVEISRLEMNKVKGGLNITTADSNIGCTPSIVIACEGYTL